MMKKGVITTPILKVKADQKEAKVDLLAVEEPLEIRLGFGPKEDRQQRSLSVTMRTPGHDFELALGFLFSENIIQAYDQVHSLRYCKDQGKQEDLENILRVELSEKVNLDWSLLQRNFYTSSSCGVCGKSSIESVRLAIPKTPQPPPKTLPPLPYKLIHELPAKLRQAQNIFEHTGSLHAAALFDWEGNLILMREDVGRHNALDKIIGASLLKGFLPLKKNLILLSGRSSFELVQKSLMCGLPFLAAVGAPSSLAVQLAQQFKMTLLGFVRNERFNVYSGEHRLI